MKTPIFDFVEKYQKSSPLRLHMPGHKGTGPIGVESKDITEIDGADVLYHETGILKESQENASFLFGSKKTLYSTEGSTLCIRAMLALTAMCAKEKGKKVSVAAGRDAHKSFLTGCALLDIDPIWIHSSDSRGLLSNTVTPEGLQHFFEEREEPPTAVYITSPDYLGHITDTAALSEICHRNGSLLLVDNAHGAYLHFFSESHHPISLGADIVCDSAHKTLPVLTGGAYLHISKNAPDLIFKQAESAMAIFASTSPSYLILQSLDACNKYLNDSYHDTLYSFCAAVVDLKKELRKAGFSLIGDEPCKITIQTKSYGYTGEELAGILQEKNIFCEFSDPDYLVLMLSPVLKSTELLKIKDALTTIPQKAPILAFPPKIPRVNKVLSPREALFSPSQVLPLDECVGRILAQPSITCPPAVPIAICGEMITKEHLEAFRYYNIRELSVI